MKVISLTVRRGRKVNKITLDHEVTLEVSGNADLDEVGELARQQLRKLEEDSAEILDNE